MSHPSAFWDRIAPRYAKSAIADEASYRHKLAVTRQHFTPNSEVLEFGCGTGSTAIEHAPYVAHYLATDISYGMLEIARARADGQANLSFERTTIDGIPGEQRFDVVLGMSILHLVDNLEATLSHVHRLLRPGGVFASSTICMGDKYRWFGLIGPLGKRLGLLPRVSLLTRATLESSIEAAGFTLEYRFQPTLRKAAFLIATRQ